MTSELDQTCAKATQGSTHDDLETKEFEEALADAVYDELSLISSLVAPALDICVKGASTVEIGLRKTRLNMEDCEEFERGLEKVFGFGAKVIECRILKALNTRLGISKELKQNFRFSNEVKTARELYKFRRCAKSRP
jgi:hypothetical protein